jgi:hypothetical protein
LAWQRKDFFLSVLYLAVRVRENWCIFGFLILHCKDERSLDCWRELLKDSCVLNIFAHEKQTRRQQASNEIAVLFRENLHHDVVLIPASAVPYSFSGRVLFAGHTIDEANAYFF